MELKSADVNLDRDKFNGRTPVQQCWDYLNALPDCPWGIVSNFVTFRLYHRDKTPLAYEEFRLQELRDVRKFRQFYCLFERGGLVRPRNGHELRAPQLLQRTEQRQRTVGDELYDMYSENRLRLIEHLSLRHGKGLDAAIFIAQRILDRIIFIAFCEDRDLLPPKCIDRAYQTLPPFSKVTNPRWRNFVDLFAAVDKGRGLPSSHNRGYNGGLFAKNPEVDDLQLDDEWTNFFHTDQHVRFPRRSERRRARTHFREVGGGTGEAAAFGLVWPGPRRPARKAGHAQPVGPGPRRRAAKPAMPKSAERKRFGIYYTPPEFTAADRLRDRPEARRPADRRRASIPRPGRGGAEVRPAVARPGARIWQDCFEALRSLKICDPACGSGAFLVQAYDALEGLYEKIVDQLAAHDPAAAETLAEAVPDTILADNIHGVDLSPQAVEITQLALWIRSARREQDAGETVVEHHPGQQPRHRRRRRFPRLPLGGEVSGRFSRPEQSGLRLRDRQPALGAAQGAGAGVFRSFRAGDCRGGQRRGPAEDDRRPGDRQSRALRGLCPGPGSCPSGRLPMPAARAISP